MALLLAVSSIGFAARRVMSNVCGQNKMVKTSEKPGRLLTSSPLQVLSFMASQQTITALGRVARTFHQVTSFAPALAVVLAVLGEAVESLEVSFLVTIRNQARSIFFAKSEFSSLGAGVCGP